MATQAPTIIRAGNFQSRSDLENEVAKLTGSQLNTKQTFIISGTREELERVSLNDRSTVFGVRCEITDSPTPNKIVTAADRGVKFPFGINNDNQLESNESK